jgi:hypothetical protein
VPGLSSFDTAHNNAIAQHLQTVEAWLPEVEVRAQSLERAARMLLTDIKTLVPLEPSKESQ